MRITLTQGMKNGQSINLFWGRTLPGDIDAPIFESGTLVLGYTQMERPAELMDDWQMYETVLDDKLCFVVWTVAATLVETRAAIQALAMELDIYPYHTSYLPECFEELLWLRDGEYVKCDDLELYRIKLGLRQDDTWGVVLEKVVTNIPFPNDPFHRELARRCLYGHSPYQTGSHIAFHNPIRTITVRAWLVTIDGDEIVSLKDYDQEVTIMDPKQVEMIQTEIATMELERQENPYMITCNKPDANTAPFIWAMPWQSERMRTEQWRFPQGVYNLGEDDTGENLVLALGYWPEAGETIEVNPPSQLREYLLEPVGDGTRLDAINKTLDFVLALQPRPDLRSAQSMRVKG